MPRTVPPVMRLAVPTAAPFRRPAWKIGVFTTLGIGSACFLAAWLTPWLADLVWEFTLDRFKRRSLPGPPAPAIEVRYDRAGVLVPWDAPPGTGVSFWVHMNDRARHEMQVSHLYESSVSPSAPSPKVDEFVVRRDAMASPRASAHEQAALAEMVATGRTSARMVFWDGYALGATIIAVGAGLFAGIVIAGRRRIVDRARANPDVCPACGFTPMAIGVPCPKCGTWVPAGTPPDMPAGRESM